MPEDTARSILINNQFLERRICERIIEDFRRLVASAPDCRGCGKSVRVYPNRTEIVGSNVQRSARKDVGRALSEIRIAAREALRIHYAVRSLEIEFTLLTEMRPGDKHHLHADNERQGRDGRWEPNHTPWRDYAAMVYLNSAGSDFDGGLLRFPQLERVVAPCAGSLVAFNCGHEHEHEVSPIERGNRYSVSIWFTAERHRAERW